ncbi:antiviral helicase [Nadsonia fulvescens var. elongata DSM 6958]|uniref:Antiviral helicase n=1 Tax=Nadsonia fulvescens var. elongata DSM 6958 TaxID=857566 RepID=A0A1E3PQU0_9ASCO|nr:antiviral helicase [Nadsonia fulvescens var. elongata DSM 6958]
MENFHELVPRMAREFPFELDTFQKEAVYHLEQGDSVFVAAHTSAGKTVVAEYAIAMAQRNMTKAIYTSPIKALSNQKFRDFKQIYDDVGILTGDVQINPEASCLIMTTEILRSMLYRGADVIRDVEFVIFDEVHYVNDQDRGVVWEEVIIMLPEHVKFILLSATVPNTFEFANWVGRTKQKNIYVISTPKRPVPLEHSLWVKGRPYKIVGAEKKFLLDGYNAAADALAPKVPKGRDDAVNSRGGKDSARGGARGGSRGGSANGRGGNSNNPRGGFRGGRSGGNYNSNRSGNAPSKQTFMEMINYLKKNNLLPVTIFVFSKKKCEQYAHYLNSLDFCTASDKNKIRVFIDKAVARLRKEDRDLPQIIQVREWLSRGIAVHHGGLLPIVKEVIEILFAESLIKVLFATETFAMGLNLPTRTVIFSGCRKHDGRSFRDLLPGEYTQMAGRAGRRGLDTTGTVYIMSDGTEPPTRTSLELMLLGNPTKLQSQFRLTYNMILNLLRVEALKVEDMIKRSFSENSAQLLLPEHQKSVQINETLLAGMVRKSCDSCDPDIDETHDNIVKYQKLVSEELEIAFKSSAGRKSLSPGRVIIFQETSCPRDIAITINSDLKTRTFKVLVLSNYSHKTKKRSSDNTPYLPFIESYAKNNLPPFKLKNEFKIKTISFDCVEMVTKHIMDRALIQGIIGRDPDIIKAGITWINDIAQKKMVSARLDKIKEVGFLQAHEEKLNTMEKLRDSKSARSKSFLAAYKEVHEEYLIKCKIESLKSMISDQNLELLPDYEQRIEVLQELNYVDPNLNVLLKGRVACEVNAGFELILTELILENFLGDYEPEEIVALLSCFVFDNGSDEPEFVTPRLDSGKARILGIVNRLNGIFNSHQILQTQEEIEFADRKRFGLMEVVYEWAKGLPFKSVIGLTDIQEGVVVRVITRLDEICREVKNAARIIGDTTLHDKMDEAQTKIKRDIVFCASLYL